MLGLTLTHQPLLQFFKSFNGGKTGQANLRDASRMATELSALVPLK